MFEVTADLQKYNFSEERDDTESEDLKRFERFFVTMVTYSRRPAKDDLKMYP